MVVDLTILWNVRSRGWFYKKMAQAPTNALIAALKLQPTSVVGKTLVKISNWHTKQMGYRQMGLKYDDLLSEENPIVEEAVKRLTPSEYYERLFRTRRALNLSVKKEELPSGMWTTSGEVCY